MDQPASPGNPDQPLASPAGLQTVSREVILAVSIAFAVCPVCRA
jgi:hypothetical protein